LKAFDPIGSVLEGHKLIEASAGTGKTTAVTSLYLRLLLERSLLVKEILVITFTNAAIEELKTRVRQILSQAKIAFERGTSEDSFLVELLKGTPNHDDAQVLLQNALYTFDEAAIFTIHGFCQRVLQEKAFESSAPFDMDLMADSTSILKEIRDDYWRLQIYEAPPLFQQFVLSKGLTPETLFRTVGRSPSNPFLRVIPQCQGPDPERLKTSGERLLLEFERLRESWNTNEKMVEDVLLHYQGLKRNQYKEGVILKCLDEVKQYLSSAILFELPASFSKLCPTSLAKATRNGYDPPQNPFFQAAEQYAQVYESVEQLYEGQLLALRVVLLHFVKAEMKKRTRRQNVRFFDDLLLDLYEALRQDKKSILAASLRGRYKAVLVDEFQDTDPMQYFILSSIFTDPSSPLFLIGDPKQAIYSFRGADVFAYMKAAEEVSETFTLEKNWRSSPNLVAAVNALFRRPARPFVFEGIRFHEAKAANLAVGQDFLWNGEPEAAPLKLWFMRRPPENEKGGISDSSANLLIPRAVATEIVSLLEAAKNGDVQIQGRVLSLGDIAVLVRTNSQARLIQKALQEQGLPALLYTNESVFRAHEAMETERVLWGIAEAGNESKVKAALATDLIGLSGNELAGLEENEVSWDEWLRTFAEYRDLWTSQGLLLMARVLMSRQKVGSRLLRFPDGERRMTNLLQIFELLHQASLENQLGIEGVLKWLAERRQEDRSLAPEEHQLRLETDERAVKVVTVHKSKGLQFPVVFCPFSWDGPMEERGSASFHDPRDKAILVKDLGSEEFNENQIRARREALSENARLLYVALTRARYRSTIVWGALNGAANSALTYLLCHPAPATDEGFLLSSKDRFQNLADAELEQQLKELVRDSEDTIELLPLPEAFASSCPGLEQQSGSPACRRFSGEVPLDWGVASFTSLVAGAKQENELPDRDALGTKVRTFEPVISPVSAEKSIFEFPRGLRAGNVLHEIFESLNLSNSASVEASELIRNKLREHGFDPEWEGCVRQMIQNVLSTPLETPDGSLFLSQLSAGDRLHELEFTFPLDRLTSHRLRRNMAALCGSEPPGDFVARLEQLEFSPMRGWLKGFIDLVFQHNGRFYLLDWKSNYLGGRIEAYRSEALREAVAENYYFLQYYLYTLALHRYLGFRLRDYHYSSHFGGVFYIFLRGVDPERGTEFGIFKDRPSETLIRAMEPCFTGA
jgi:exodeoxyribonuclease V beta subunit